MNREEIISAIESMTVLELADLVKELEEKFGVSAAAPVAVAAAPAAAAAAAPEEEKTRVRRHPQGCRRREDQGHQGRPRSVFRSGPEGSQGPRRQLPKPIKEAVSKEAAEEIKKKFAEVGATVEIK